MAEKIITLKDTQCCMCVRDIPTGSFCYSEDDYSKNVWCEDCEIELQKDTN